MIFQNKSVALICPAPHISKVMQTSYIEGFDLVVRVNKSLPIPRDVRINTTDRCDVLYVARNTQPSKEWEKVKEIRLNPTALWEPYKHDYVRSPYVFKRKEMEPYKEKIKLIDPYVQYTLSEECGCQLNIGMKAIFDILLEEPKLLYVTGMTFYKTGSYYDDYKHPYKRSIEKTRGNIYGHNQDMQINFLKRFLAGIVELKLNEVYLKSKIEVDHELGSVLFGNTQSNLLKR